jgi:peptidoglycan hydrolase-like protein with peptidoglycan-binding domain
MYLIDIFLPVLIGPHMKHKFFIAMILMFGFVGPAMSDTVSSAQRILNQLGYNAGPIDGAYGKKTRSALEIFYSENGSLYDGKLDANEVVDLTAAMDAAGLDTYQVSKVNEFNGKHYLQDIVEAGTGIEPVYTDLQSAA